jgi:phosphonatase-like hydrolase
MIQLAVFDMAGTTVNENNVVYKTLRSALEQFGFEFTLAEVLEKGAGKEKLQAIIDLLKSKGKYEEQIAKDIHREFKLILETAYLVMEIETFPNIPQLLQVLKAKDIKVVLNTGYDRATALHLIGKLNWRIGTEIDGLVTASDVENGRPAPDMILKAMEEMGITDAKAVLKAGDSAIDIEEGKNAGCGITIGVTTGAQTEAQLAAVNPDYILDDLAEILEFV